jgi:hypothetical protein
MNTDRRFWATVGIVVLAIAAHAFLGVTLGRGYAIPTTLLGVIGAAAVLKGPFGDALAHRLHGAAEAPSEQLLAEVDELRNRVAELEERVDFSERLLARQRDEVG